MKWNENYEKLEAANVLGKRDLSTDPFVFFGYRLLADIYEERSFWARVAER